MVISRTEYFVNFTNGFPFYAFIYRIVWYFQMFMVYVIGAYNIL